MANVNPSAAKPEDTAAPALDVTPETKPAPEAPPKTTSHDLGPPAALVDFMMKGWKRPSGKAPPRIRNADRFRARRDALAARFPGETLVIPTGHEKLRANDTTYRFRPGSDLFYFTGNHEPDCVLVLAATDGGHDHVLWVEPNPGKTTPTFFTDRAKGELWVGPRLGVEGSRVRYGVDEARALPELPDHLRGLGEKPFRVLRGVSHEVDALLPAQPDRDAELAAAIAELRLRKDASEVKEIEAAIALTRNALEGVIASLPDAGNERVVEAIFDAHARLHGNGVGYGTIAAGGANACILHWTGNDAPLRKDGLLLIDAGVEGDALYTADVTRTIPVSGKFSKEQREIYDIVLAAQHAAIDAVKPGADFLDPHRAASRVLAEGLERLGLLDDAEEALKEENQFYKRWTLHGTSHMLGLDVHDCAKARPEKYRQGKLEPGMILTVEPGLYFQLDDELVPKKYRGIGIRIEEDVLVTARGNRILTEDIPREAEEIEAWMASIWALDAEEEAPAPAKKPARKPARKAPAKRAAKAAKGPARTAAKAGKKAAGAARTGASRAKAAAKKATPKAARRSR